MSPYGWYVRFPSDLPLLASTRDLIDWASAGGSPRWRRTVRIRKGPTSPG